LFILAVALAVAALTLVRERRLRRALARLLHLLLTRWRNRETTPSNESGGASAGRDPDDLRLR
jgi:hypothetical protein